MVKFFEISSQQVYENDPSNATDYFFYFGIDLQTTFQSPILTGHAKDFLRKNSFKMAAEGSHFERILKKI